MDKLFSLFSLFLFIFINHAYIFVISGFWGFAIFSKPSNSIIRMNSSTGAEKLNLHHLSICNIKGYSEKNTPENSPLQPHQALPSF